MEEKEKIKSESYQEKCLRRASERSDRISGLIRVVVFAGFGLIWVILQASNKNVNDLSIVEPLGMATAMLCGSIIVEFCHLIIDVSSNLYQGCRGIKFATSTSKRIFLLQWFLWYLKALLVIGAYLSILYKII